MPYSLAPQLPALLPAMRLARQQRALQHVTKTHVAKVKSPTYGTYLFVHWLNLRFVVRDLGLTTRGSENVREIRFANYGVYLFGHWLDLGRAVKHLGLSKSKDDHTGREFADPVEKGYWKTRETEARIFAHYGMYLSRHWLHPGGCGRDLGLKEKIAEPIKVVVKFH